MSKCIEEDFVIDGYPFYSVLIPGEGATAFTIVGPDTIGPDGEIESPLFQGSEPGDVSNARATVRRMAMLLVNMVLRRPADYEGEVN